MKVSIKIEELAMFIFGVYLFNNLGYSWWWFFGLILAPDIAMLGYLADTRVGAIAYNIFHHKAVAIFIYLGGIYFQNEPAQLIGIMLFTHASMDRIFGYGLKYFDSFSHTHLGSIGKTGHT